MTESIIKKFEEKGFTRWTKYDMDRLYINAETLGLEASYYKSGNVSYAEYRGEKISNRRAGDMLCSKIWIDVETGKLCSKNADSELLADAQALVDQVIEEIKDEYKEASKEEKAKKIVTYLREAFGHTSDEKAVKIVKYIQETFGEGKYDNDLLYYNDISYDKGYRALCELAGTLEAYDAADEGLDQTFIACDAAVALGAIEEGELI